MGGIARPKGDRQRVFTRLLWVRPRTTFPGDVVRPILQITTRNELNVLKLTLPAALTIVLHVSFSRATEAPEQATLVVEVQGVRNGRGQLRVGVFDDSTGFPTERNRALLWRSIPADAAERSSTVSLPPGRYAVVVLHDENENKQIDKGLFGIPKEGYGVTNNPMPKRRAARYAEAEIEVPAEGRRVEVKIQYSFL